MTQILSDGFGDAIRIGFSSMSDGSMSKAVSLQERDANRTAYLTSLGATPNHSVLVHLTYETVDFCKYHTVTIDHSGDGIAHESPRRSDAVFTTDHRLTLLLPVADCIGAVLYDPVHRVLGLAHLGRHNLEQFGGTKVVQYMSQTFKTDPKNVAVWLSPAAGNGNYPLHSFEDRSMHDVAVSQMEAAGVISHHISVDPRDTTTDLSLYSHSEFLKGNRAIDGRQAVVVMMQPEHK